MNTASWQIYNKDLDIHSRRMHVQTIPLTLGEMISFPFLLIGTVLFGFAQGTWDVWIPVFSHLVAGTIIINISFPRRRHELRFFLLTYAICIFWGGLSQIYSLFQEGNPTGFVDAVTYFGRILDSPPYYTWDEMMSLPHPDGARLGTNAPLAVWIWQRIYNFYLALGCSFGSHIGVTFNAMVVGLSAAVTVATARILFCGDPCRMNRVGWTFSLMGLFWLYGSLHLRDCFALLLNTIVLYSLIRALSCKRTSATLLGLVLVCLSSIAIYFIRDKSAVLFGIFAVIAGGCWYWRERMTPAKTLATLLVPIFLLVGFVRILDYLTLVKGFADERRASYEEFGEVQHDERSLGMALVVKQPLPIRCVLGLGVLLVNPIPLWGLLRSRVDPYNLFMTWNGICMLFLVPWIVTGVWFVLRSHAKNKLLAINGLILPIENKHDSALALLFLKVYILLTAIAFTTTTLAIRHYGQFLPGLLLVMAIPDRESRDVQRSVHTLKVVWFGLVVSVHLAWLTMKLL